MRCGFRILMLLSLGKARVSHLPTVPAFSVSSFRFRDSQSSLFSSTIQEFIIPSSPPKMHSASISDGPSRDTLTPDPWLRDPRSPFRLPSADAFVLICKFAPLRVRLGRCKSGLTDQNMKTFIDLRT